jgi:DNA-binding PadR family transcriptional regulator
MSPAVFAHGHLRLYLLSLLGERSMHGYELIQALADRFGGTYVPSAGTIYPRLAKLEEEGLVTKTADGRKTVYAITDAGRAELAEHRKQWSTAVNTLAHAFGAGGRLWAAFAPATAVAR